MPRPACCALFGGPAASDAVPALVDLIERITDWDVFKPARYAFKAIGPSAVPALVDLIERSQDEAVLWRACQALGAIGPAASEAVPALADFIERSGNRDVLEAACWALEAIGESALPALRSLTGWFSDVPKEVKKMAREAIVKIEKRRRGK